MSGLHAVRSHHDPPPINSFCIRSIPLPLQQHPAAPPILPQPQASLRPAPLTRLHLDLIPPFPDYYCRPALAHAARLHLAPLPPPPLQACTGTRSPRTPCRFLLLRHVLPALRPGGRHRLRLHLSPNAWVSRPFPFGCMGTCQGTWGHGDAGSRDGGLCEWPVPFVNLAGLGGWTWPQQLTVVAR